MLELSANAQVARSPSETAPTNAAVYGVVDDVARSRSVLFGGFDYYSRVGLSATWERASGGWLPCSCAHVAGSSVAVACVAT